MNKKIFAILMVLICALSISTVSAADDTSIEDVAAVAEAGSFTELKSLIDGATTNTVNLDKNYTYSSSTDSSISTITINKSLTIDGKGHTIDASNKASIFTITKGTTVTIKNITFINGNSINGGAINNNGTLNVYDECDFINNSATNMGGAINNDGSLNVYGACDFINNSAAVGGVFNNDGSLNVYGACDFINNSATDMGGVFNSNGNNFNVYGACDFINNSAAVGGVFNSNGDNLNIRGACKFIDNSAAVGGVFNSNGDNLNIYGVCDFINNSATNKGGVFNNNGSLNVYGTCKFINNSAVDGGAINNDGTFSVQVKGTCDFINNSAVDGGAINNDESLNVYGVCRFINNSATNNGGAINNNKMLDIRKCEFINNSAVAGGAINNNGTVEVCLFSPGKCEFINNSAVAGGAINNDGELYACYMGGELFINNNTATDIGGAINNNGMLSIGSASINNNTAPIGADIAVGINSTGTDVPSDIAVTVITSITIDPMDTVVVGENVTVSGNVSGIVDGANITIKANGKTFNVSVANGTFYYDIGNFTSEGNQSIIVEYAGNENYTASKESLNITVVKKATTIAIDDLNIFVGEDAIIIGNITGIPENSTIIITVNGEKYNTIVNGTKFLFTVENLTLGSYNITASYDGTLEYEAASDNATVTVSKYPTVTTIVNITDVLDAGDRLLINATVTSQDKPVNGTVELYINGKFVTKNNAVNGNVSFNVTTYAGKFTVMVKFAGDDKYDKSNATHDIAVNGMNTTLTVPDITLFFKNGTQLIINLTSNGTNVSNETVIININGVDYTKTVVNGTASLNINLAPGTYNTTVTLLSEKYNFASENATVTVLPVIMGNDTVLYFKNGTKYVALFLDGKGNPLDGAKVQFNINGIIYNRTTDANGTASLNINLAPGKYIITAINTANGALHANNITVLPTIIGENIVKYYKNETQYIVKVLDGKGNALANQTVEYNINGVFYKRTTDANGTAVFNINLAAGNSEPKDYIVTAVCNGCIVSNNVTVLPVLTAEDFNETFQAGKKFIAKIVDGEGKPLEGAKIQFNINGVFYNRTSDVNGTVGLNINLAPGEYIITTICNDNGAVISNKVTVTPKV